MATHHNQCVGFVTKLYLMERLQFLFIIIKFRFTLTVIPIRILSMSQKELFKHFLRVIIISHLKPYSCVQIMYMIFEYFINRIINFKHLQAFNCVQNND